MKSQPRPDGFSEAHRRESPLSTAGSLVGLELGTRGLLVGPLAVRNSQPCRGAGVPAQKQGVSGGLIG